VNTVISADADRAGHYFLCALCSLEMVLVNHNTNASTAFILKAANYAAVAVNLNITTRTHNIAGKQDREIDDRTNGDVAIHGEEDTVGRDVLSFRQTVAALRFQFHG